MLIDWFTVVAQAVNFLILVWLLQRFLYKPVLAAIDAREAKIAAQLTDAAANKKAAEATRDEFRAQSAAFDQQRSELLRAATAEANAERQRLLDAARKASELLSLKLSDALKDEHAKLNREIVTRTQEEVFALARGALVDLAGTTLEDRLAEVFISRLGKLPGEQKALLAAEPRRNAAPVQLRSAFELTPATRGALEAAVRQCLGADTQIEFQIVPNLVCGIELTVDGQKVGWSIGDYLALLAQDVTALLEPQTAAASGPTPITQHAA
jgi:F-type H+-transporting ATPase subunit b